MVCTVRDPQRRIKDLNPTLTETVWKCDTSQHPVTAGETGVVGRSGAADPHGHVVCSGVNSSRPVTGRSRGIKSACDGTARFGACGQDGEAAGLVPAVLHPSGEPVFYSHSSARTPYQSMFWYSPSANWLSRCVPSCVKPRDSRSRWEGSLNSNTRASIRCKPRWSKP